jgi:hypothetical protein
MPSKQDAWSVAKIVITMAFIIFGLCGVHIG